MTRVDKPKGGYTLTADVEKYLAVFDSENVEIARAKSVEIPAAGTLNKWVETDEKIMEQGG